MTKIKTFFNKLFYPPTWLSFSVPIFSYVTLILVFLFKKDETLIAIPIYALSAYSLIIICLNIPSGLRKIKTYIKNTKLVAWILSTRLGKKYFNDLFFRESISIYQGISTNAFYTIFNAYVGLRYKSAWFISIAVYYFILGLIKSYLVRSYKHRGTINEVLTYRRTARFLFLLNIPMLGMIILMITKNSGFNYEGYVIYLSALYTFYSFIVAFVNIIKYRKVGSPILSAIKSLNFVAAMMSILGLQTAMLNRFSDEGEAYRIMMNKITGGFVIGIAILAAIFMLIHSKKLLKNYK